MRDLSNNIHIKRVLSPSDGPADDTPQVGQIIDRRGFNSLVYVILTGTLADANATFAVLLEHGDDPALGDAAAVPDAELIGTEALAGFAFGDDDEVRKLGYVGGKRYTRLTITPAGNAAAAPIAACAILGDAENRPTPNPPI